MMNLSVIILSFNSEQTLAATLESARKVSDDIHVVDSFSTDSTPRIIAESGAQFTQHEFVNYGAQRNWAMDNLGLKDDWVLHLDADERLSDGLADEINTVMAAIAVGNGGDGAEGGLVGYYIPRLVHFMGRAIRHGGMYPIWHMRLFRKDRGRCEARRYDQHFMVDGSSARLSQPMIDDLRMPLSVWVARHNRWAEEEAREVLEPSGEGVIGGDFSGTPVERKRALRRLYYRLPPFLRAFAMFFYRYVLRLGFLDGKEGLVFFVLQTFWFRFLVDAKILELRLSNRNRGASAR